MVGFPGDVYPPDEFQDCFNMFAGHSWLEMVEVETYPGFASIALMRDPEKAYYIASEMVKVIDGDALRLSLWADRVELVHNAIGGFVERDTLHALSDADIAAIHEWLSLFPRL